MNQELPKVNVTPRGGSYQVGFVYKGRRYRRSFKSPTATNQWVGEVKAAMALGSEIPEDATESLSQHVPFNVLVDRAVSRLWSGMPGEASMRSMSQQVKKFLDNPRFLELPVSRMTEQLYDFRHHLLNTYSKTYAARVLACTKSILGYCFDVGRVKQLPKIQPIKLNKKDRDMALTEQEVIALCETCVGLGYLVLKNYIMLAVETGLRPAEMFRIKLKDISNSTLAVRCTKTKTDRSAELSYAARLAAERIASATNATSKLFRGYTAQQMRYEWDAVRQAMGQEGNSDWVPYILRHTFVTRLVKAGLPLPDVQVVAGHADIKTTMKYIHLAPVQTGKVTEALLNPY